MSEPAKPSDVLKAEHQVILRAIRVLDHLVDQADTGANPDIDGCRQCVRIFRLFADACHHAKEEDLLFPALERCGIPKENGPIGVMLYEHSVARSLTRDMAEALDAHAGNDPEGAGRFITAARTYIELLTNHIYKEDNVLFAMGDRVLGDQDRSRLCQAFCEVACRKFEGSSAAELEGAVAALESRYPVGGP